jgi:hypothetical protein
VRILAVPALPDRNKVQWTPTGDGLRIVRSTNAELGAVSEVAGIFRIAAETLDPGTGRRLFDSTTVEVQTPCSGVRSRGDPTAPLLAGGVDDRHVRRLHRGSWDDNLPR